ncbi:uncharacterized protein LOC141903377 [Tubulanus polymorphus]|uniref:uncharacterized protein LOC141903377 n=1 Tax=Tubulanus polymorphus TaxID=672921 RepID=UPI003DA67735
MDIRKSNAIPVGIAVARKRENQSKQQQKSGVGSTTTQIGATQNSRKDREEFLRQQKELLSPQNKPTQCHRPELTSNLIVTGGNNNSTTTSAASILGWHETDTRSHHLAPPHPPWPIQAGSAMAPTFWLGQGPYSLPSALPVDPISMATSNGWKLAQDPLTGQLYIIPATNLDMLDPTRMWSGYASGSTTASIQPLLTGHSSAQLQQNHDQNRLSASHSNIQKQNDDGSSLVKVSSFSSAQIAPISLPITTSASSLCCETKDSVVPATNPFLPRGLTMGTGQTYPYTYPSTPIPLVYDPNYMPPVAPLTPAISEPMMQSRGTSPMVFMSNMSDASIDSASEDNGPSFSAISTAAAGVLQSTTSVQTSDLESMKDSSSQSSGDNLIVDVDDDSQTEEEERRVDEEPSEELEVAAVVDSTEPMISSTTSDKCGDINVDVVDDDVDCDRVDSSTKCDPDSDGDLKIDCDKCRDDDEEGVDLRTMESLKTDSECIPSVESESIPSACDTIHNDESAAKFDESDDAVNVVSNESESKENMCEETCKLNAERPQRSLSGLDALVQVISNDLESEEFCSSRSVQQPDDDRLIDNSFKNLGSNLASVFKYPDNVFSLTSDDLKSSSAKMNLLPVCNEYSTTNSGLDLLSALAEQRRDELISPQSRKSESSLSSLCSPDINRNYEGSLDKWDMSSLSSPGSSSGARTRRESGPNSPFSLYNEMDMTELEMRMKLAEIQRRYKEKQKELAKLQPRKDRDHDSKRGPGRPKKRKLSKQSSKSSDCKEMLSDGDCKSPKILEPPPPKKKKTSSNKPETESKEVKLKVSSKSVKKKDLTISQVSPPVTTCKSDSHTPKPVVAVATIQSAPVQKHKSETEDIRIATKPAEISGSCEILKPLKQEKKKDAESVMKKKQKFENEPLKPSEKSASKQTATTIKVESHAQQKQPFIVKKEPMSDSDSDSEDSWMTLQELAGKVKRESQMQIDSIKQQTVTGIDTSGLGLLAKYASASTVIDAKTKLSEKKSNKDITNAPVKKRKKQKDGEATSESPMSKKRKPGRPKKLSPEKPSETETIVAKKPKNIGLQLQLDLERKKEQQQNTGDSKKDQIKMKPEKKDDTNISLKMKENKAAEVNKKDGGREIDRKKPSVKQETEKVTSNLKEMKTVGSKQGNVLVETTKDQERNVKKQKSETQMDKKETHKNKKEVEEPNVKKEKLEVDTENKKEEQMPITKNMDNKEKDKNKTALVKKETTMTKNNESKKERNEMDKQDKEREASNKAISEMRVSSSTNNDIRNAELTKPLKIETDSQKWSHEWSIRRSERIFLSDSSPQQSPNMGPIYRSPPQQHQQPQSSSPPTHNKSSSVSPPSDKKSPLLSQMQTLTQKVKKKYSKAAMNKGKKKYKLPEKFKYSEIYTDSEPDSDEIDEEDEDSDNKPLTAFIEKSRKAELQSCVLDKDELKDGLRILLFMEDLFYEGEVKAIQPPDIYGVLVYGERGNRPHILPQEELLREAVLDLKPKSPDDLPEGRRICAYWSQQFSCLYPGTVAKSSPNPDANKNLINVEFDDGDSGKIPMDHIRMLPQHFPQCCTSESTFLLDPASKRKKRTSSEDLMCLENKERKPSLGNTLPGFNLDKIRKKCSTLKYNKVEKKVRPPQSSDSDGSSFEMSNLCEQLDNIVSKERKKKKYKRIKDMTEKNLSGNKNRSSAMLKKSPSHQKPILSKSHFKNGADFGLKMKKSTLKIGPANNRRNANNSSRPSLNWASSDDERCSAATSSEEESSDDEQNNSPNKQQRRKSPAAKTRKSPTKKESKSSSKTDVLIPLCDIWSWHGKSTQRPGLKGKAKKIYFKAIQRGDEIIKVGDSAVFISTGRPHLPYVGRIENLWEAWGGNMVVRVKWFYHPEETKGCGNKLTDPDDALFESPHGDDNDVQTISHRCEVLSYKEYRKRAVSDADMTDVYYLAGYYDPVLSYATFRSHVSRM